MKPWHAHTIAAIAMTVAALFYGANVSVFIGALLGFGAVCAATTAFATKRHLIDF